MIIKDSEIVCDAPSNNYVSTEDSRSTSTGIGTSTGETRLYNVNVKTTDYGVGPSRDAKLYVKGGTFQTHGHGPFYFSNRFGENYIENAKLISHGKNNYDGEFSTENWEKISSCMYMGGGDQEHNSGVSAYFNNCIFDDEGSKSGYFVLRGTSNEQNLNLYISNTQFTGSNAPKYRVDSPTDHVYFGQGNTWPETELFEDLRGGATKENNIHNTDEIYKKNNVSYLKLGDFDYKKVYIDGDKFDKTNLNIKLIDENGGESLLTNYEIINEQEELTEDQDFVTVKYNELELQIPIKVFSNDNYDLTISNYIYNSLDSIIETISYIEKTNNKIRFIVKKEAINSIEKLDFSDIDNEIDSEELSIFSNLKEIKYSNNNNMNNEEDNISKNEEDADKKQNNESKKDIENKSDLSKEQKNEDITNEGQKKDGFLPRTGTVVEYSLILIALMILVVLSVCIFRYKNLLKKM